MATSSPSGTSRTSPRPNCRAMQPVRIAVVGAGMIGQAHIKRILEEPQAELAAIIDPSSKTTEQAKALGVPCFADLETGLQAVRPDVVVIATPNQRFCQGSRHCPWPTRAWLGI